MRKRLVACVILAGISSVGCYGPSLPTRTSKPAAVQNIVADDGGAMRGPAVSAGDYTITLRDRVSGEVSQFHFSSETRLRQLSTQYGTLLELHGKMASTFYLVDTIESVTVVGRNGSLQRIELSPVRRPSDCQATDARGRRISTVSCYYDPGPCIDCAGPMAPGGELACRITHGCGGDADLGTGSGIGIFRSVYPQLSCEFDFSNGAYDCTFDVINTDSPVPMDLTIGYSYNATIGAQELHCAGPPWDSTVFLSGLDGSVPKALGFPTVNAGRSIAFHMFTNNRTKTSMQALYFRRGTVGIPISYIGKCAGSN
jgi:hypothetical protein